MGGIVVAVIIVFAWLVISVEIVAAIASLIIHVTEKTEWDHICEIATSVPTDEQKEKAEKLRKKFHPLSFKSNECPYCRCKLTEAGWDEVTGKIVYKCLLCEEKFIYL